MITAASRVAERSLRTPRQRLVWSLIFPIPVWILAAVFTVYTLSSASAWQSVRGAPEVLVAAACIGWLAAGSAIAYFVGPHLPRGPPDPKEFL